MARYKTFDSTGIAPNGRLYAGDLNAIQDFLAKAADFTQTIDVGTLRVGDSSIQLLKYGTAEARISAALRTDGVIRGLGGIAPGSFTTTQRDAIAAGLRPTGMAIFNTTTNRSEINIGTDAAPIWAGTADPIPGVMFPWPYSEAGIPGGWAACYGQSVTKIANPILWARASADGFPHGGDANNVTLPDMRGRVPVGKDNMGGAAAGRVGVGNAGQTLGGSQGIERHPLIAAENAPHAHAINEAAHQHVAPGAPAGKFIVDRNMSEGVAGSIGLSGLLDYQVYLLGGTAFANTGLPPTQSQGSGTAHQNMQPGVIINWIIKLG